MKVTNPQPSSVVMKRTTILLHGPCSEVVSFGIGVDPTMVELYRETTGLENPNYDVLKSAIIMGSTVICATVIFTHLSSNRCPTAAPFN
ncbi:hypothetical protein L1887_22487 [Cichorium endivia]|nr:hypothetical protein L1887_22487 [Cichorium endivia]